MLFENSEKVIDVTKWANDINSNPDAYKNIFVRRFTHVKNLGSYVLHEYLNVIVEDDSNDTWTRVIVERQRGEHSKAQDQLIVGRWPPSKGYRESWEAVNLFLSSSGSSSGSVADVPLPLVTRSFEKGKFSVRLLANILLFRHNLRPKYDPLVFNCYWYAAQVFESPRAYLKRVGRYVDYPWPFASWKGDISKIPQRWRKAARDAAEAFRKIRAHFPVDGRPIDNESLAASLTNQYQQKLKEVIDTLREELSNEPDEITGEEKEQIQADIKNYHASIDECIADETQEDGFEKYLEIGKEIAYEQKWNPLTEYVAGEEFLEGPTETQISQLKLALLAFVGRLSESKLEG